MAKNTDPINKKTSKPIETKTKVSSTPSRINAFLRYFSIILVIVFTSFSLITLTIRSRLLTPDVYKNAIDQSGIYELITDVIVERTTQALIVVQREIISKSNLGQVDENATLVEKAVRPMIASVLESATSNFVVRLSERIGLEEIVQNSVEKVIDNDIAWLLGERQAAEIFKLIPPPDQIEAFRETGFDSVVNKERSTSIEINRITNLPICPSVEEAASNVALINQGDFANVSCTNDEITLLLSTSIYDIASNESLWGVGGLFGQIERLGLEPIIDTIYEISLTLANFKQDALILRDMVSKSYETSMFLLLVTLPLVIYAIIVTKSGKLTTLLRIYLATGLVIVSFGIIGYLSLTNIVANFAIDIAIRQEGFLDTSGQIAFSQGIESIKLFVIRDVCYYVLLVGSSLVAITATPLLILKILNRSKYSEKKSLS